MQPPLLLLLRLHKLPPG